MRLLLLLFLMACAPRSRSASLATAPAEVQGTVLTLRPTQPGLFSTPGALVNALADVDADGDADLFVGFNGTPNRLYRNDRGLFTDVAAAAGVADARATRAAAFGDWDADGDADLLVGFAPGAGPVLRLYRNDKGRFTDATALAGLTVESGAVRQPVWVDFDADDDLDLFIAFRDRPNMLLRNTAGRLTDIAAEVGLADARKSVGAVWADLDADGDLDLIVANMDGDANGLFRNDGGRFTDVAEAWGLAWGGRTPRDAANGTVRPCVADVNGDGRLDLVTANYGTPGLFLATADGKWTDAGAAWGIAVDGHYDSCALADVDHDGRLDLYINGTVTQGRNWPDYLYRNTGTAFSLVTPAVLTAIPADHGAQWADLNGDRTADLVLAGQGPHAVLFNELPPDRARRSLQVRVRDARGFATRAGAEVRVYAAGTRRLLGMRLVDAGSSYDAQSEVPVHLGLAESGRVDIEVTWPANGVRQVTRKRNVALGGAVVEVRTTERRAR
ncbi:MAG: VCBS repeat-containing protein [Gemmatimonadetes bacterium]|nr:VCBS repeat-containing protein [Gemmatimonadota bacterium]